MRYSVLGITEARDGDLVVPLGGGRLRALLTVLAVNAGRAVTPEELIAEVWPSDPPADAPGALQALVVRLRKTLGRDAIRSEPGGYRIDAEPDAVDLHRFERLLRDGERALATGDPETAAATLTQALALWRGPALADLPDRTAAAARPEALRLTALRLRVEADLALGRSADALHVLRQAVADHPLDEAFRAQLIRALRAEGRTADALMAYDDARTVLAETLGTDPGPELKELHAELLGQPPLRRPAPAGPPLGRPAPPPPPFRQRPEHHRAPQSLKGNLRARLTSFVGRETELRALAGDLTAERLITLTGPGGSGKTRLSQEAAEAAQHAYPDGVWLAELASLDDPAGIPHTVLSALGRRDTLVRAAGLESLKTDADDPLARVLEHCAQRRLLLVLDNCEHVVEAAARFAAEVLAVCPEVTVLATSREPLGVPGEVVRPVEPLPPRPAYRLFAERAAAVRPGAADATRADADAVHEICRRLDGLPLAIELAAARLRALTPRQIADRLDDRFRLLTSGSRTLLPRQQTLRAVVDWSWDLLTEPERTTLSALSVFAGGCTLAAAEAVCGPEALETVAGLVDKSLVVADHGPPAGTQDGPPTATATSTGTATGTSTGTATGTGTGTGTGGGPYGAGASADKGTGAGSGTEPYASGTRYRLLETIHEYAAERAREHPEALAAATARHTAYYRELTETVDPRLRGPDQLHWLGVMEAELDNVRAALHRAVETRAETDAIAIVLAMGWFWWLRNFRDEAETWLGRVAALGDLPTDPAEPADPAAPAASTEPADPAAPPADADPLYWQRVDLRMLRFFVNSDHASEEQWSSEETLATAAHLAAAYGKGGPRAARFPGLLWPFTLYLLGGTAEMRRHTDDVVANCRTHGGEWEIAAALMFRTHVAVDTPGGLDGVDADRAELQLLSERVGDRWLRAQVHGASAEIESIRGEYAAARADFEAAFRLGRELGAYAEGAFLLSRMADLAHRAGDDATAAGLLDQAAEEAERYGVHDARTYIRYLRALLLLHHGDPRAARDLCDLAMRHASDGTPPPTLLVCLLGLSGRITAAEGDDPRALATLAEAARTAVTATCTDTVLAAQLDAAADVLASPHLDDLPAALLMSSAADTVRGPFPRSTPEHTAATALHTRARARLTPAAYAAAVAAGSDVTRESAVRLLTELSEARRSAYSD